MNEIDDFIEFLNDNMNDADEKKFVESFAIDIEFRSNFKKYIAATGAINKMFNKIEAPPNSKEKLFSSIGIITEEMSDRNVSLTKNSFFKSRLFSAIATGIFSILATILIMTFSENQQRDNITENSKNEKSATFENNKSIPLSNPESVKPDDEKTTPIVSIKKVSINHNKLKISEYKVSSDIYSYNNPDIKTGNVSGFKNSPNITIDYKTKTPVINPSQPILTLNRNSIDNVNQIIFIPYETSLKIPDMPEQKTQKLEKPGFTIELKNSVNWNLPKEKISPSDYNKLNNMELGVYYDLFKNFKIGLSVRQETYYLEYSGWENSVQHFDYE